MCDRLYARFQPDELECWSVFDPTALKNCALSLAGRKINRFYLKIPPLSNYEEEWLILNYFYLFVCL